MYKHSAVLFGRALITTCVQAQRAPLVDIAQCKDASEGTFAAIAIYLPFWRLFNRSHRSSAPGLALVLGWCRRK